MVRVTPAIRVLSFVAWAVAGLASPAASAVVLSPEQARALKATEGFATSPDGTRIYYRSVGSGEVVIAPFALYHGTALDRLASGRRIVTYDPRGRGKSQPVPPDRVSRDLLLSDLDAVRRAVGAEKIALIGWSGGGMETFVYTLNHPGVVTRLVQLAPVGPRFDPYSAQMMADRSRRTDAAQRAALDAKIKGHEFAGDQRRRCREEAAVNQPALFFDRTKWTRVPDVCVYPNEYPETIGAYFGGLFKSIQGFNLVPSIPKVQIPRLVIHALQDNIPLKGSNEWVAGQANARLMTIDRSGHFPLYEQPDATLAAIATFLDGQWPAASKAVPAAPSTPPR
jgi:proline iminopeptidase